MIGGIDKAIFLTNIFASNHPQEHIQLWAQFEKEVPASKRTGVYGMENKAYISWLKETKNPVFLTFLQENMQVKDLGSSR